MSVTPMKFKAGWKPSAVADALLELRHELDVFEKACARLHIPLEKQSLRRWRLHSAIYLLQLLHEQEREVMTHAAAPQSSAVPPQFAALVQVTVLAKGGLGDAAELLRDIARRLDHDQLVGSDQPAGLGTYQFSTTLGPALQQTARGSE